MLPSNGDPKTVGGGEGMPSVAWLSVHLGDPQSHLERLI